MKILGIETSCDETAAAIVEDGRQMLANFISSQISLHSIYGGVVPEIASRQHIITIIPAIKAALTKANISWKDIDAIAVTYGPGLAGSLLVGVNVAKSLAYAFKLPLIGINHLEGHIYANWLGQSEPLVPCLCLIVSGGHSDLVLMKGHNEFIKLGQTRDDAAGEAFDKGARILGLGYPGGPLIEKEAQKGKPCIKLPRAWLRGSNDFSFSGLKTALLHTAQSLGLEANNRFDLASSFQHAIVEVLGVKTINLAKKLKIKQILLAGGVASNKMLCSYLQTNSPIPVLIPPPVLCTDNAAMIASCAYYHFINGHTSNFNLDVIPGLSFAE